MTPSEYTIAMTGLDKLVAWIKGYLDQNRQAATEKRAQMKVALESLVTAASKTRQHQAYHPNDTTQNKDLAELWNKAAMDMWVIDYELASTYLLKADYWSDPAGWTKMQKDERTIQLDEVYRRGQEVLRMV